MSRSKKHTPVIRIGDKSAKRFARRRVRHYRGTIPNGSFYKKLYPQYDITDWWFFKPSVHEDIKEFKRLYKELQLGYYNDDIDIMSEVIDKIKHLATSFDYLYK